MKQAKLLIGKHSDNDLVIDDLNCPEFLLEIVKITKEKWELIPVSNDLGVLVNKVPLVERMLVQAGDVITINNHSLTLELLSDTDLDSGSAVDLNFKKEMDKLPEPFESLKYFAFEPLLKKMGENLNKNQTKNLYQLEKSGYYCIKTIQVVGSDIGQCELSCGEQAVPEGIQILLEDDELWVSSEKTSFQVNQRDTRLSRLFVGDELEWQSNKWKVWGPLSKCREEKETEEFDILSHLNTNTFRQAPPPVQIPKGEMEAFRKKVNTWLSWRKNSLSSGLNLQRTDQKDDLAFSRSNENLDMRSQLRHKVHPSTESRGNERGHQNSVGIPSTAESDTASVSVLSKHRQIIFSHSEEEEASAKVTGVPSSKATGVIGLLKGGVILVTCLFLLGIAVFIL